MNRPAAAERRLSRAIALLALELKLQTLLTALERWYAPDWPRVPAGNPDGGQWMDGGGRVGNIVRIVGRSPRVAMELTPLGTLHSQIRLGDGSQLCVYDFGRQHWMIPSDAKVIGCPAIMTQSIFTWGSPLNDNWR